MAFELKVTSSTQPIISATGGTLSITDNLDGTWQVTSSDSITEVWFDYNDGETLSPNVTKVECIEADSLTSLEKFCMGLINLTEITFEPEFITSNVTKLGDGDNVTGAFALCSSLTTFSYIDTSSVENFMYTWFGCSSLTTFSYIDTSSGRYFYATWYVCSSLTTFPCIDTSNAENLNATWAGCSSIVCFAKIDTRNATDTSYMFVGDTALLRPNASEQAEILAGALWVNDTVCGDYTPALHPVIVPLSASILCDSVSVEFDTCSISLQVNRFYNTATFTTNEILTPFSNVSIVAGDTTFEGFIYSIEKQSNLKYSVMCRSHSAKLTEPFISSSTNIVIPANTSHGVCAYYEEKYGITINITAIDLEFGGDFQQQGTVITALTTIANVTGAEYWEDEDGVINIHPNKIISGTGTEISSDDIFNFIPYSKNIENQGVGIINIGTTSIQETISTDIKCSADVDKCSGLTMIRVVPYDAVTEFYNISPNLVQTPMIYQTVISPTLFVTVEADIESINTVSINGALLVAETDYTFNYDTIVFNEAQDGILVVDYVGYGYSGYVNIIPYSVGKFASFDVYYGTCEPFYYREIMECDGADRISDCGGIVTIMPSDHNYAKGFDFQTVTTTMPSITFYSDSQIISETPTTTTIEMPWVEQGILSIQSGGTAIHTCRFTPTAITEIRSRGVTIDSANYSISGDKITFNDMYLGVVIAYTTPALNHYVKFANLPDNSVRMSVSGISGKECTFNLDGYDQDRIETIECVEGVDITVNVREELEASAMKTTNRTIPITYPDTTTGFVVSDVFGIVTIESVVNGTYTLNTNGIVKNSQIIVRSGAE